MRWGILLYSGLLGDLRSCYILSIVCIGVLSSAGAEIPAINSIRAIRVLRAVRLLRKSKSLKPIVDALFASLMPVLNSMILLGLI